MPDKKNQKLNRREFLSSIGVASTGAYSLMVLGSDPIRADLPQRDPDEIREAFDALAPMDPESAARRFEGEPHMTLVDLETDLLVAGGGPAGVCAALSAARNGAKVILIQDRSRLGGNSSSEIKMHIVGANSHRGRPGWREGGIIEELRLDDAANNPHRSWEMWDLLLYDKIVSEPNITLLLDTAVYAADVSDGKIQRVMARCDKSEHLYRIKSKLYADCTGDARLAVEAGASIRWGHESRKDFNEPLAWDKPSRETLGSSILFTSRDYGSPVPYRAPKWARKIGPDNLRFRPIGSWEYGYWWIEWGGITDTIRDNERIRFELLAIVTGVWDYIKNSGKYPEAANWGMDWVGMVPGKRESRRVEGDHILTQQDLMGLNGDFKDAVSLGGWGLDEHPPGGFDDSELRPFVSTRLPDVYNIPLRSLYSKDISNLMMAGRNASCSHVAFTSTRVMATCAGMGQGLGTAAAVCLKRGVTPRKLYQSNEGLFELQQTLLKDDQTIKNLKNLDPADLARQATKFDTSPLHQTAKPENVISGMTRDMYGEMNHRWIAPMQPEAWLSLGWSEPKRIRHIQVTFDTGFHRELTLTSSDEHSQHMVRAPQPETIRDYKIIVTDAQGQEYVVAEVSGNHQRIRRHEFKSVDAVQVKLHALATNGSDTARVYEIRCYA